MNAIATVVVLLALVAVVLLWKLLVTAAGIGGAQWLLVSIVDDPAMQVLVFAVPALLMALVLSHGLPRGLRPGRSSARVAGRSVALAAAKGVA